MFEFFYDFDLALATFGNAVCKSAGAFFTPVFNIITHLGSVGWAFILAGLIMLLFKKTRKVGTVVLVAIVLGALFTNIIIKNAVKRPRPYADESSPFYGFWVQAGSMKESEYSFPSGHATVSAAFAVAMLCACNKKTSWLYLFIPLIMSFTRIYFQVHFASDVLFGMICGGTCGVIGWFLVDKLFPRVKLYNRYLQAGGIVDWVNAFKNRNKTQAPLPEGDVGGEQISEEQAEEAEKAESVQEEQKQ